MRLKYNQTSKGKCFYIIRSVYRNGKNTSETYEKLGYLEDIKKEHLCPDPEKWIQEHLDELNALEQAEKSCNRRSAISATYFRSSIKELAMQKRFCASHTIKCFSFREE